MRGARRTRTAKDAAGDTGGNTADNAGRDTGADTAKGATTGTTDAGSPSRRRQRWAVQENARRRAVYSAEQARWRRIDSELAGLIAAARTFTGYEAGKERGDVRLILRPGERMFCLVPRATLLRAGGPARVPTAWYTSYSALATSQLAAACAQGHPFGRRREPRWTRESGAVTITDQRVVFHGADRDWEWSFAKLVGVEHGTTGPSTLLHVSNREELSGLAYPRAEAPLLRLLLGLALAHRAGDVRSFVRRLESDRAEHTAARPELPRRARPRDAPATAVAVLRAVSTIYFGRRGQPVRWRLMQFVAATVATVGVVLLVTPHTGLGSNQDGGLRLRP